MGGWYRFSYRLSQVLAKSLFAFKVVHPERIIEEGGAILAMNHESYLDPPLAGIACRRACALDHARCTSLKCSNLGFFLFTAHPIHP